jgi:hypothetical protein
MFLQFKKFLYRSVSTQKASVLCENRFEFFRLSKLITRELKKQFPHLLTVIKILFVDRKKKSLPIKARFNKQPLIAAGAVVRNIVPSLLRQ